MNPAPSQRTPHQPGQPGSEHVPGTDPIGGQAARMWDAGMGRRKGGGRKRRGDVNAVVPDAEFRSYYGRAVLKPPVWTHEIAYYLFAGGLAAGSSMLAAVADAHGHVAARRVLRTTSLGAVGASAYFLIADLGRPERFYNMLRVAKVTSPMSVGTYILSVFGPLSGVAAASELAALLPERGPLGLVRRLARPAGSVAGVGAALTGPLLATYTAVLFADTAVPSWHEPYRELPFVFGGSALAAGAGTALLLAPTAQTGSAARVAAIGATVELAAAHRMETSHGLVSEPFHLGRPGKFLTAARTLTASGAAGAVLSRALPTRVARVVSAVAGASLLAGSFLTRMAVFEAGVASTKDPKYVVVPQRERLEARRRAS
ncbi:NrfD/PsrC family molybdoenzyme membrane anchor subunit [Kineococcus aurantiacus]|uniref:Formate-dependent nitrite reductase membrane component NrfD n=1 Tax=Kineococcus aurantiacus TaxID=37633 RepID=A0A7Y9DPR4_9ACTN|nr:NrfD/PsrC family molybdoenzyme membrane anchor subunit [Kineococcus aurantiacus]NYD24552.1 formate-dependent nitrite reductase membrane component NrfD [Kineococcus aurantiacus]